VPKRQFPIEIFLFKTNEDFLSVSPPNSGIDIFVNAYFLKGADRNFIVSQDRSPDDVAKDVGHALGHEFLNRSILWHPFWLEEGAAEYFRNVGRNPDSKRVLPEDRLRAGDILKIVPSAAYNDADPVSPFRLQAYRLLRIALDQSPAQLRSYITALKVESGRDPTLAIDVADATDRLSPFTDTRILPVPGVPAIQVRDVSAAIVAVHRGDALVAARQTVQASRWYEGDSQDARAARAILARISGGKEAAPVLERSAQEMPGHGLLQYYFGTIETTDERLLALQGEALERAMKLLPLMGRVNAEMARVLTLRGKPTEALALLDKALILEPEFADRFYMLRVGALLSMRQYDESKKAATIAVALPHGDRAAASQFEEKLALVEKTIRDLNDAADRVKVDELRASLEAEARRREPPKPPPPPPAPDRAGEIKYEFEATNPVEILSTVYPDYPDALVKRGKTGKVSFKVKVGVDGKVTSATITDSQLPEMNAESMAAAGKWTFKPYTVNGRPTAYTIKLIFAFSLQ
jgi:TonB family protein